MCKLHVSIFHFRSYSQVQGATCDNWIFHVTVLHNSILLFLAFNYYNINCAKNTVKMIQHFVMLCQTINLHASQKNWSLLNLEFEITEMSFSSIKPSKTVQSALLKETMHIICICQVCCKIVFVRWFYTEKKITCGISLNKIHLLICIIAHTSSGTRFHGG